MIKVRIPTPLRPLTKNQGEVEVTGANIGEIIDNLNSYYSGPTTF